LIHLRHYQTDAIGAVRSNLRDLSRKGILCMPTGSGKTKTTTHGLCKPWLDGKGTRVYWLVERQELVGQGKADLEELGHRVGLLWSEERPDPSARVQVASVQSLETGAFDEYLEAMTDRRSLIIGDEIHSLATRKWIQRRLREPGDATWLGLTATPFVSGPVGLRDLFDWMVNGPSYRHLTLDADDAVSRVYGRPMGALTPIRYVEPLKALTVSTEGLRLTASGEWSDEDLVSRASDPDVIDALLRFVLETEKEDAKIETAAGWETLRLPPSPTRVAFCIDVNHAHIVAERAALMGLRVAVVAGEEKRTGAYSRIGESLLPRPVFTKRKRKFIFRELLDGRLDLVCSCDALSKGWDCPPAAVGIMLRPWRISLANYLQQTGRIARTCAPWKLFSLLVDAAGNVNRWGRLIDQPLPDLEISRGGVRSGPAAPTGPRMKRCPECGKMALWEAETCEDPDCGYKWPERQERTEEEARELVEGFSGQDIGEVEIDPAARIPESKRRRIWYAYRIREAYDKDGSPWEADGHFKQMFDVEKIPTNLRYLALFGGLPSDADIAKYRGWLERWAPLRAPIWRKEKTDRSWVRDMMRREGIDPDSGRLILLEEKPDATS